jgi:hypothetical protein
MPSATVREPLTYTRSGPHSYFADILKAQRGSNAGSLGRLSQHGREMAAELPDLLARMDARSHAAMVRRLGIEPVYGVEQRVNPGSNPGQGGYFTPPLWILEAFAGFTRPGRPFADAVSNFVLPPGVDSVSLPKITSEGSVGVQTADNSFFSEIDFTDAGISGKVQTFAGIVDAAQFFADQMVAPGGAFDEIIFTELAGSYASSVGTAVFAGAGALGQILGIDNVAGTGAVTFTSGAPTLAGLAVPVGQAASLVATSRKLLPSHIVMNARRWFWMTSQSSVNTDGSNARPFSLPDDIDDPANAIPVGGLIGQWQGLPVLADQNVTTVDGAAANQDRIYAVRASDMYLWETVPSVRVITEILSGTLSVRYQLSAYVVFLPHRYPNSISIVTGTGLAAPAGYGG